MIPGHKRRFTRAVAVRSKARKASSFKGKARWSIRRAPSAMTELCRRSASKHCGTPLLDSANPQTRPHVNIEHERFEHECERPQVGQALCRGDVDDCLRLRG